MTKLGIVCCYFNPCGFSRRLENYNKFRAEIERDDVQLLTVELAFNDLPFQLSGDVLQLRSNSIMWHKERLLNIGIQRLIDDGYEKIIWCDADIMFVDNNWSTQILRKLDKYSIIQCFDTGICYFTDARIERFSIGFFINNTKKCSENWHKCIMGGSWGITAELFKKVQLYEYCVMGGGDSAFAIACMANSFATPATDLFDSYRQSWMSDNAKKGYLKWVNLLRENMSDIGYTPMSSSFLSHGSVTNRKYRERYNILKEFDPDLDLTLNECGAFEWTERNKNIESDVMAYFYSRKEDD